MHKYISSFAFICFSLIIFSCCRPTNEGPMFTDNFDRNAALTYWANDIIIPSFEAYKEGTEILDSKTNTFFDDPSISSLEELRSAWLVAYKLWQHVSMFDIGMAETIGLRAYTNIFPSNTNLIENNVFVGIANLELPSNFSAQGFPAIDYLLFGIADSDEEILNKLILEQYKNYLIKLTNRIDELAGVVLDDWNGDFKQKFIDNDGSSNTASLDKLVNDYLFYYEKYFRAGKIGIPAGVFSGNYISTSVEAPYSGIYSKELYDEAFIAIKNFFNGLSYDQTTEGPSIKSYLDYVRTLVEGNDLASEINAQWDQAALKSDQLDNNFKEVIEADPIKMLELYDELQKAVVLLKVEMLQDLNIKIDYVDADGD